MTQALNNSHRHSTILALNFVSCDNFLRDNFQKHKLGLFYLTKKEEEEEIYKLGPPTEQCEADIPFIHDGVLDYSDSVICVCVCLCASIELRSCTNHIGIYFSHTHLAI